VSSPPLRAVFDCNVFLQGLSNANGPAGRCISAVLDGRILLCMNDFIIDELVEAAESPKVCRKLRLLPSRVRELLDELDKVASFIGPAPQVFRYDRDPDDAQYINNIALASGAQIIVSRDKDLLDLMAHRVRRAVPLWLGFPRFASSIRLPSYESFRRRPRPCHPSDWI